MHICCIIHYVHVNSCDVYSSLCLRGTQKDRYRTAESGEAMCYC